MTHEMKLRPQPYSMIASGKKTFELRLYDEKRQKIKEGDTITFRNIKTEEKLSCVVLKLHVFPSFCELYNTLPLLSCGYTEDGIASASYKDMEDYYSPDEQAEYGVVGIEIEVI